MSQPDLFVVCRNCGSEVSPYVTECPYCGQRVRKRAPKIERSGTAPAPRRRARRRSALPRLRRSEIPGVALDRRPYATGLIVVAALAITVIDAAGESASKLGGIFMSPSDEPWRLLTTPFVFPSSAGYGGYELIALTGVGVFGASLERRFGWWATLLVFLASGVAGGALAVGAQDYPFTGANGAALGLAMAWLVDDRFALARGDDRGRDLIGAYVFAAVLMLVSIPVQEASVFAALGGAAAGAALGAGLAQLRR
ncbi:MAG: rhomboid family intramembrane serine protease [Thermoleophilaceae bacterium]|nr:rhomboid family intramembrane serine protease [Thermoleophilaceae bacterium]